MLPRCISARHLAVCLATPHIQQGACLLVLGTHQTCCSVISNTFFLAVQRMLNTTAITIIRVSLQLSKGENWVQIRFKNLAVAFPLYNFAILCVAQQ